MSASPVPLIERCPVGCDSPLVATNIRMPEGPLRRCTACGQLVSSVTAHRYLDSMSSEFNQTAGTFPTGRALMRLQQRARWFSRVLTRALKRAPKDITLLDVGASSGSLVSVMAPLGFRAMGVEPAPKAAEGARARGLDVRTGTLQEVALPDGSVDAITLFEVIEHLADPVPLLKECQRVLRPGGVMLILTGNGASLTARILGHRWGYFQIDSHGGHISFFNPDSMGRAAARAGFRVERVWANGLLVVERKNTPWLVYRASRILVELLAPFVRLARRGHDMRVLLRKP